MWQKFNESSTKTKFSVLLLFLSLVGIGIALFELLSNEATRSNLPLMVAVTVLIALFLAERASGVFADFASDLDRKTLVSQIELLPRILATDTDLVTFLHASEARKYCIAVADQAVEIKNTVIRYGRRESTRLGTANTYKDWVDAKRKTLGEGTVWTELVSRWLDDDDEQRAFMAEARQKKTGYYPVFIDDKTNPMLNTTIFTFRNGVKEAIFGYEYLGIRSTPTFLTRNNYLVTFLEGYFRENEQLARASLPELNIEGNGP